MIDLVVVIDNKEIRMIKMIAATCRKITSAYYFEFIPDVPQIDYSYALSNRTFKSFILINPVIDLDAAYSGSSCCVC